MSELKIGLEIHIQLNTGKLFCACSSDTNDKVTGRFIRTLFPTSGELGATDRAALFELSRGRIFEYSVSENSCLVEMDEEPPHGMNENAVRVALSVSTSLKCLVFPSIFVMRKIVVDGSNTTGFQRTSLVGVNGGIDVEGRRIGISSVCLEEDSARKISQDGGTVVYSLDRLGIPLIEIATDPDIKTAAEAMNVAREIGYLAASTGIMRQGADAIRQDVNMSIGFGRVEIKGVSKLSLIRDVIEAEMERQINLNNSLSVLEERGEFSQDRIRETEVTDILRSSGSRVISAAIRRREGIYALVLPNMKGILKSGKHRLGREIAESLRPYGIMGLMHGDELPGYGIEQEYLERVLGILEPSSNDSFAIIAIPAAKVEEVVRTIGERLKKLLSRDFSETRAPNSDGSTFFLRPLPGRERMYPETDIPTFDVSSKTLRELTEAAPKSFEEQVSDLSSEFNLSRQDASTILRNGERETLLKLCEFTDSKFAGRILIHMIPALEKELQHPVERDMVIKTADAIQVKSNMKYSLEPALRLIYSEKKSIYDAVEDPRVIPLSEDEIRNTIRELQIEDEKLSEKTLISQLRKRVARPFDPVLALKVFKETSKR